MRGADLDPQGSVNFYGSGSFWPKKHGSGSEQPWSKPTQYQNFNHYVFKILKFDIINSKNAKFFQLPIILEYEIKL